MSTPPINMDLYRAALPQTKKCMLIVAIADILRRPLDDPHALDDGQNLLSMASVFRYDRTHEAKLLRSFVAALAARAEKQQDSDQSLLLEIADALAAGLPQQ